jgi:hypothetical protein
MREILQLAVLQDPLLHDDEVRFIIGSSTVVKFASI